MRGGDDGEVLADRVVAHLVYEVVCRREGEGGDGDEVKKDPRVTLGGEDE